MAFARTGRALVLVAVLLAGSLAATPVASAVSARSRAVFTANLVNRHSNLCLSLDGARPDDGARVLQWDCGPEENQQWNLSATDSGYYRVRALHSGKCLSVSNGSTGNGATVIQWECGTRGNQQWKLVQKDDGYFAIEARHSDKCLSVSGAGTSNGATAVQWDCGSQHEEHWRLG
jgi:hypothetical protein